MTFDKQRFHDVAANAFKQMFPEEELCDDIFGMFIEDDYWRISRALRESQKAVQTFLEFLDSGIRQDERYVGVTHDEGRALCDRNRRYNEAIRSALNTLLHEKQ